MSPLKANQTIIQRRGQPSSSVCTSFHSHLPGLSFCILQRCLFESSSSNSTRNQPFLKHALSHFQNARAPLQQATHNNSSDTNVQCRSDSVCIQFDIQDSITSTTTTTFSRQSIYSVLLLPCIYKFEVSKSNLAYKRACHPVVLLVSPGSFFLCIQATFPIVFNPSDHLPDIDGYIWICQLSPSETMERPACVSHPPSCRSFAAAKTINLASSAPNLHPPLILDRTGQILRIYTQCQ
jgi:hypothetical protein